MFLNFTNIYLYMDEKKALSYAADFSFWTIFKLWLKMVIFFLILTGLIKMIEFLTGININFIQILIILGTYFLGKHFLKKYLKKRN